MHATIYTTTTKIRLLPVARACLSACRMLDVRLTPLYLRLVSSHCSRAYIPVLYVFNKIDAITIEELDILDQMPNYVPISSQHQWNLEELMEEIWNRCNMLRIYTKPKGQIPDYDEVRGNVTWYLLLCMRDRLMYGSTTRNGDAILFVCAIISPHLTRTYILVSLFFLGAHSP